MDLVIKFKNHEETLSTLRKEFEGFNFKHKQAMQILDAK